MLAATAAAVIALLVPKASGPRVLVVGGVAAAVAVAGGSTAYAVDTASTAYNGSIPSAGPTISSSGGFGGGPGGRGGFPGGGLRGELPQGGFGPPQGSTGQGGFTPPQGSSGSSGPSGQGGFTPPTGARTGGGFGGTQTVSSALTALLKATDTTWAAATIGSQTAAPLELASGKAVMSIGGFNGSDPTPTLAAFEKLVQQGKVRYFIGGSNGGGPGGGPGGGGTGGAIANWVAQHYTAKTVGNTTVYDLAP